MKCLNLFIVVFFLVGCVNTAIAPQKETISNLTHAYIVPMEPPPLGVPPQFNTIIAGLGGSVQWARGFGVYNTIAFFLEMPEASRRAGEVSQSLQEMLNTGGVWVPTAVLANEVGAIFSTNTISNDIAPGIKPIPGVTDRSYTVFMENWLAPIRSWYNNIDPVTDYSSFSSDQSTFILEVGIINYEITDNKLFLEVVMKMIDPSTGRVIGRTREGNPLSMPQIGPTINQAFSDDAKLFKEVFTKTGQKLVRTCLVNLGLVSQ